MDGDGEGRRRARRRPWISLIVVLCVVVGSGVLAGLVVPKTPAKTAPVRHHPKQPLYAKTWDPAIRPLAATVEKYRGLTFAHPVFVELMTDAQFDQAMSAQSSPVTSADRRSAVDTQSMLRALGEISDTDNLLQDMSQSTAAGVIGFYSYETKHVLIRGLALTPATRLTVIHELTHALDDQHFNLGAKMQSLQTSNPGGEMAFDAIVEGDARRIEAKYRSTYSKNELIDLPAEERAQLAGAQEGDHSFPGFLSAQSIAAYPLGLVAVTRLARTGGNRAVNAEFRKPPMHELLITHPWLLGTSWKPAAIPAPVLATGDTPTARGEFGALDLYLLLSETVPLPKALAAADAWSGDRYVTFTHNEQPCVRIVMVTRGLTGARALLSATAQWAKGHPGDASARMHGLTVTLAACSPGDAFTQPADNADPALELLVVRNQIEGDMEKDGLGRSLSVCFAQALPGRFSTHLLETGKFSAKQRVVLRSMALACQGG